MASAKIVASTALRKKRPRTDKKVLALLLINLTVTALIALKLFGVI